MLLLNFTNFFLDCSQYFEQDDPDLYLTKVKYILEHDVNDMDLYFTEEDYDQSGQLVQVSYPLVCFYFIINSLSNETFFIFSLDFIETLSSESKALITVLAPRRSRASNKQS